MTGRERVNRMFERREHDRVPRHETFWPQTIERWQSEGLDGDWRRALDLLDSDFVMLSWCSPRPFPGQDRLLHEDEQTITTVNDYGATERRWKQRGGTPEHVAFGCTTRDAWEQTFKPALLAAPSVFDFDEALRLNAEGRGREQWCFLSGIEAFEFTRHLMGDEVTLIAMAEDPEWIAEVARTHTDLVLRDNEEALRRGVEAEVERLAPLVEEGGYIGFCDHRVPPDVPLEHYLFYLRWVRRRWGRGVNLKPMLADAPAEEMAT